MTTLRVYGATKSFSALQRAENSSIVLRTARSPAFVESFSALQRAENSSIDDGFYHPNEFIGFSALQRAENSSIDHTNLSG